MGAEDQTPKNILIVGAGGIGCQLIKNLYKSHHKITIMDYDIISYSNLNRQFCFNPQNIGTPKVDTLISYFTPLSSPLSPPISPQPHNLLTYPPPYFNQFDLLISALDSNQSRWYLNQIAIDHDLPMIDAGTAAWNGQVVCFVRGVSECRMCRYGGTDGGKGEGNAVCLVRGRPERNLHCVQFGLEMYGALKSVHQRKNNGQQIQGDWKSIIDMLDTYNTQNIEQKCRKLHDRIFGTPILKQPQVQPIFYKSAPSHNILKQLINNNQFDDAVEYILDIESKKLESTDLYSTIFIQSVKSMLLCKSFTDFDKDNPLTSIFIYSCTNLRIHNFHKLPNTSLSAMSFNESKDKSGKIIPAIASTNSIAAALEVLMVVRLLGSRSQGFFRDYISIKGYHPEDKIQKYLGYPPKPACPHCSCLYNYAQLYANMSTVTWGQLQQFLVEHLDDSLGRRDIRSEGFIVVRNTGRVWHKNLGKMLEQVGGGLVKQGVDGKMVITVDYVRNDEPSCIKWKISIIDSKQHRLCIKKGPNKQQLQEAVATQLQKQKQVAQKYIHSSEVLRVQDILVEEEQIQK